MSDTRIPRMGRMENQEIHLRDYIHVILKRKAIILSVFFLTVLITAIVSFTAVPIYTASSHVLLERNRGGGVLEAERYYYEPDFLNNQTQIIKSLNVAQRVVRDLELATKYRHYFIDETQSGPSFFGSVKSSIKQGIRSVLSLFRGSGGEEQAVVQEEEGEGGQAGQLTIAVEPLSDEEIIAYMVRGGLSVKEIPNTKIVSLGFSHKDPSMAKLVADAVVQAYMDELLEIKLANSSYALKWMTEKAKEERERLEKSERELQQYMRDNDLITVENRLAVVPQRLSEFSSQLSKAEAERKEYKALIDQIDAAGGDLRRLENLQLFADNQVLKKIRDDIYTAEQNIKELAKKYGPKHPAMLKATDELDNLNREKRSEIERVLASTRSAYELAVSREDNLRQLLADTKAEVLNLNEKFIQYSIMKRDVDSNRVLYDALESSIKKENVTEQSQSVNVWVVKKAELPGYPSYPRKKRNLMLGMILGLFSGIGLAFFIEYLDNTVKSEKELENKFGIPVLGSVQKISSSEPHIESYIVRQPLSPVAECYRLIRSSLMLSAAERPPRVILFTSMATKEGKSTTTVNVARVLAQGGKKVLIVDCDLRRPRMHSLFGMKNETGLTDYLTGNARENIIRVVPGEELAVITSGPIPPNPAELLVSMKMKNLVEKLKERFDFILLDSPPVESVTDGLALSKIADGTIVVVRYGQTTFDLLASGLKKLADVKTVFLGFVMNGVKKSSVAGGYYYGYNTDYAQDS